MTARSQIMRASGRRVLGFVTAFLIVIMVGACQSREPESVAAPVAPEYKPTATVRELMHSVIDPAADVVWLSVYTILDGEGIHETRPQTDEELGERASWRHHPPRSGEPADDARTSSRPFR